MQPEFEYMATIKPSRWLLIVILCGFTVSFASVIFTVVYVQSYIIISVVISFYLIILSYSFFELRFLSQIKKLIRFDSGQWQLELTSSNHLTRLSLLFCYVCERFIILHFKSPRSIFTRTIFLTNDHMGDEEFRQLKVYCRDPKTFLK